MHMWIYNIYVRWEEKKRCSAFADVDAVNGVNASVGDDAALAGVNARRAGAGRY